MGFISSLVLICLLFEVSQCNASVGVSLFDESTCELSQELVTEIASYDIVVKKIVNFVKNGKFKGRVYRELAKFVDDFGNRLTASENLERAIDHLLNKFKCYGLDDVHGEEVEVPHWVRGQESAELLQPRYWKMSMLGLGGSVGTPPEGITAEVVVVETFDELANLPDSLVKGKIVVFCQKWVNYGVTVKYRTKGATAAAKKGAVASLIKSVTPVSINSPHTGMQFYDEGVTKVPSACITIEDAEMLLRMYRRGEIIKIRIKMEAENKPPKPSRNTIANLKGSRMPEKMVIVSGHLDSWDVGQGAMDDGAGAFISWMSLFLLKSLDLQPRRTIRTVLWTGEEVGLVGAAGYKKQHARENDDIALLMESDEGTFTPMGLEFAGTKNASCILNQILRHLKPINATKLRVSRDVGSDINLWADTDVPRASLLNKNQRYFWFHHSNADSMTVEDADTLDDCLILWSTAAYIVADLSVDLPRGHI